MVRSFMMEDSSQELLPGVPTPSLTVSTTTTPPPLDVNTLSPVSSKEAETTPVNVISQEGEGVLHTATTRRLVSHHLLKAIELNFEGVCLLQSGDQDEEQAITFFKRSLAYVKSDIAQETSSSSTTTTSTLPHRKGANALSRSPDLDALLPGEVRPFLVSSPLEADHRIFDNHPMIVPVQVHDPKTLDDNLYVYTKAFVFQPCGGYQGAQGHSCEHCLGPSSGSMMIDTELLSATIIYNIGLALHVKAIQTNCVSLQKRSVLLYEMSMRLLRRILTGTDTNIQDEDDSNNLSSLRVVNDVAHDESMSDIIRLLMACSNNVGHLSYYLQDDHERSFRSMNNLQFLLQVVYTRLRHYEEGQERLGSSSSSLSLAPFSRRPSTLFLGLLEHHDLQGFTWNIRFMYPPTSAPAA